MSETITAGRLRPEVKTKWLTALRSGEYRQATSFLHVRDNGGQDLYCCLGVLCDLAVREGVVRVAPSPADQDVFLYGDSRAGASSSMPPSRVLDWAYGDGGARPQSGREWCVPDEVGDGDPQPDRPTFSSLAELNDEHGLTFAEIADRIEASL